MTDPAADLARDLDHVADELADLSDAHRAAGQLIERNVEPRVPRGATRRLVGSVASEVGEQGVSVTAGGPGVEYVWPIHQGVPGRGITAHPFLTDALTATEPDVVDLYLDRVDDAIATLKGT